MPGRTCARAWNSLRAATHASVRVAQPVVVKLDPLAGGRLGWRRRAVALEQREQRRLGVRGGERLQSLERSLRFTQGGARALRGETGKPADGGALERWVVGIEHQDEDPHRIGEGDDA